MASKWETHRGDEWWYFDQRCKAEGRFIKYTCSCCGYKTLPSNSMGELCPICFWEEGYDDSDNLFGVSNTNHMTLYQGQ